MNSPERAPVQTLDHQPAPRAPHELLSIDEIEQYRQSQADALSKKISFLRGADERRAEREDFMRYDLPLMHRSRLVQSGITEDDPRYPQYIDLLTRSEIETGNPMGDQWYIRDDSNLTKRDRYIEEYNQVFAPVSPDDTPQANTEPPVVASIDRDPALVGAEEKLANLRDKMVAVSAKRQSRLFGNSQKYRDIKAQYDEQLITVARLKMAGIDRTQLTDTQLNAKAIGLYLQEQNLLRTATKEKLANTPAGKFGNWLSTGSKMALLGKGALVGAGGVILGAGIGALAGGAAIVGLAAGAAATAKLAVSSARGFAMKDSQEGRGMAELDEKTHKLAEQHMAESTDTGHDHAALAHGYFSNLYEKDTKEEQEKRRLSARHGIGGAAIGMVIGGTLAYVAGELIDARPDGKMKFGDWSNRSVNPDVSADQAAAPRSSSAPDVLPAGPTPEDVAKDNTIMSSDTPAVAEAIKGALGGGAGAETLGGAPHLPASDLFTGSVGTTEFTATGLTNFEQFANNYTVQPGDTVWGLSEKYLHAQGIVNPSVYQIDAVKDSVLADLQRRGVVSSNGWLTSGQRLTLR